MLIIVFNMSRPWWWGRGVHMPVEDEERRSSAWRRSLAVLAVRKEQRVGGCSSP